MTGNDAPDLFLVFLISIPCTGAASAQDDYHQVLLNSVALNKHLRRQLVEAQRELRRRRFDTAEAAARRVLAAEPDSIEALVFLATVLLYAGDRLDKAEELLARVERQDPHCAALPNNYGTLAWARGDFEKAERYFQQAIAREPEAAHIRVNRANCLRRLGRLEEAILEYQQAIRIRPNVARVHASLASTFEYIGRYPDALRHYSRAISLTPDFSRARYARGMLLLKLGEFSPGWRDYEWRFEATHLDYLETVDWGKPVWDGRSLRGKRLLVVHEQGLGDAIHFVRYLPRVKQLGGEIILRCGPPLFRLFEPLECVDEVVSRRNRLEDDDIEYDFHVPLMSLPRIFETTLDSIPADIPYLAADPGDVAHWAGVFDRRRLNVGLVWSGNASQAKNRDRSCSLTDLTPLGDIPNVCFYSMQKGRAPLQIPEVADSLAIVDHAWYLHDLAETAAFMENLDLVITVDTVTAHLAGALGRPTWTLLCKTHCWRYLLEREDSPWYPTMTLFRQTAHGDWSGPVAEIRRRLQALAERKQRGCSSPAPPNGQGCEPAADAVPD